MQCSQRKFQLHDGPSSAKAKRPHPRSNRQLLRIVLRCFCGIWIGNIVVKVVWCKWQMQCKQQDSSGLAISTNCTFQLGLNWCLLESGIARNSDLNLDWLSAPSYILNCVSDIRYRLHFWFHQQLQTPPPIVPPLKVHLLHLTRVTWSDWGRLSRLNYLHTSRAPNVHICDVQHSMLSTRKDFYPN